MTVRENWTIRDKQRFLAVSMDLLAGAAHISFEGDLSGCRLNEISDSTEVESGQLQRNTIWPKQDFIIVPLEPESLKRIVSAIGGTIPRSILHIQIEKGGQLQVAMYDQKRAAFFDTAISENLKAKLLDERVILRAGPT